MRKLLLFLFVATLLFALPAHAWHIDNYTDMKSGALQTTDIFESTINMGRAFIAHHDSVVVASDSLSYGITTTTSTTRFPSIELLFTTGDTLSVAIYKSTVFSGGEPLTMFNKDGNSANASTLTVVSQPELTTLGTEVYKCNVVTSQATDPLAFLGKLQLEDGVAYYVLAVSVGGSRVDFGLKSFEAANRSRP